jgi:transcriptional regulator with XRE-family HTH domain
MRHTGVFADKLRAVRDRSGRSLRELQAATFVSDSSLSRYFSGQSIPPWMVVETLCDIAEVDPAELRPAWIAARASKRRRAAHHAPADVHAALSQYISTINQSVIRAIQSMREHGDPVPDDLIAAQHAAANATRLLRSTQPGSTLHSAPTDEGTK